ncbi:hypothetical protein [Sphingopyxis sp.]|uniref:hypothetical protein n=1 Tax=Sphingopyxis sp. TaxID=1908224 RepID=UPI001DCE6291|nr:hypothetical protein [Sphingopyxis sp.]MBW8296570.1 hypothetical protein [Sphingopyxis sp.]
MVFPREDLSCFIAGSFETPFDHDRRRINLRSARTPTVNAGTSAAAACTLGRLAARRSRLRMGRETPTDVIAFVKLKYDIFASLITSLPMRSGIRVT